MRWLLIGVLVLALVAGLYLVFKPKGKSDAQKLCEAGAKSGYYDKSACASVDAAIEKAGTVTNAIAKNETVQDVGGFVGGLVGGPSLYEQLDSARLKKALEDRGLPYGPAGVAEYKKQIEAETREQVASAAKATLEASIRRAPASA